MREIEIKVKVANKKALLQKLAQANTTLSEPVTQHDKVFGLPGVDGGEDTFSAPWLRIRNETKNGATKHIFTLKKSVTNQLDSIEHETEISSDAELAKIIEHIGFVPYSDVTKTRQKAKVGDIELCIDTVEGLGDFMEAERLVEETADYTEVSEELWQLLESFGAQREDQITDGYDVLIVKKQKLSM